LALEDGLLQPPATAAAAPTEQIDITQLTVNAKDMPTQHFHDMTFVFD